MFLLRRSRAGVDHAMAVALLLSSAATAVAQITGNSANGQTLFDAVAPVLLLAAISRVRRRTSDE
jgi:hypothetical protein